MENSESISGTGHYQTNLREFDPDARCTVMAAAGEKEKLEK